MGFRYFPPSPMLQGHIGFFYALDTGPDFFQHVSTAILGQVQIRLRGDLSWTSSQGATPDPPVVMVSGPTHFSVHMKAPTGMTIIGAGLLPLGWARLVRASAEEIADRCIDARGLWGRHVDGIQDAVAEARSDVRRVALFDRFLCDLLVRGPGIDPRIAAVDDWVATVPRADVDDLARLIGLSPRQMRRLTLASHGSSPKLLASKYRALRAASLIGAGYADGWRDVADGFADQAHLIRNFRRFVGHTPRALSGEETRVARDLMRAKWQAGARSSLALWS